MPDQGAGFFRPVPPGRALTRYATTRGPVSRKSGPGSKLPRMMRMAAGLAVDDTLRQIMADPAEGQTPYRLPPREVVKLVDAPAAARDQR